MTKFSMEESEISKLLGIKMFLVESVNVEANYWRHVELPRDRIWFVDVYTYICGGNNQWDLSDLVVNRIKVTSFSRLYQDTAFMECKPFLYQTISNDELKDGIEEQLSISGDVYDSMIRNVFVGATRIPIKMDFNKSPYEPRIELETISSGRIKVIAGIATR